MRRTLLAVAVAAAALTSTPASASHPCLDLSPLTCWLTRPCVKDICT